MRLNKFIAENTGVSRREADEMISSGKVTINGETAVLGRQVSETDEVSVDGKPVKNRGGHVTIILNKPVGVLSSRRSQGGDKTVYDLLPTEYKSLKTAGRLDKDSSGLIILSSDGDLIQQLTHPKYEKTKVYQVELDKPLQPLHQQMISDIGIDLPDGKSKFQIEKYRFSGEDSEHLTTNRSSMELTERQGPRPKGMGMSSGSDRLNSDACEESFTENRYLVTMHEGRNRQIRRTFDALGYTVVKLHRTSLGKYTLGELKPGKFVKI